MTSSSRPTRSRLLSLLSEACEVEHGLACSYLYASFSLKHGQSEGLSFEQEQRVRRWAAQISFVATQEMLHLAQAWNLLQAVGGTPYHMHPQFPLARGELPIHVTMSLAPFSAATLKRFLGWERPADLGDATTASEPYSTVGELYNQIERLFDTLPPGDLFITDPALQIGPELADFPDLVRVTDADSAREAIRRIRHQGEGSVQDRDDCHFGIFTKIQSDLAAEARRDSKFAPAMAVVENPAARPYPGATRVTDPVALRLMSLFDDAYGLTIRALAWTFGAANPREPVTIGFARFAIRTMVAVLRPLGEVLMRLPSGVAGLNAGPSFSISRHVPLPDDRQVARTVARERGTEIAAELRACAVELPPKAQGIVVMAAQTLADQVALFGANQRGE